jgi:hypothetical protein
MTGYYCKECMDEAIRQGDAEERHFEELDDPKDGCDGDGVYTEHVMGAKSYYKTDKI